MAKTFEQAREIILENVIPSGIEYISLQSSIDRVLAKDIEAPWGMPLWDNSAMDGFAVGEDVVSTNNEVINKDDSDCSCGDELCIDSSADDNCTLTISGYIPAGKPSEGIEVTSGTAVRIMTGAPIPKGCVSVVPVERTTEQDGKVSIQGEINLGDNVRYQGEDIAYDEKILIAGTQINPAVVSLLASYGVLSVPVYRKPKVAILSTGDELVEPGQPLNPGQIVDSNSYALAAAVEKLGCEPVVLGIAKDDPVDLKEKLTYALNTDALISSAGISVGDRDFVQEILFEMGVVSLFNKVLIKPGRPTTFGVFKGQPIFSLPGNPVSSLLTFEQFVRPALLKMYGLKQVVKPLVKAKLTENHKKKVGTVQFFRVSVSIENGHYLCQSAGDQNTGILKTLIQANGIAILPADSSNFLAGDCVDVHLLD